MWNAKAVCFENITEREKQKIYRDKRETRRNYAPVGAPSRNLPSFFLPFYFWIERKQKHLLYISKDHWWHTSCCCKWRGWTRERQEGKEAFDGPWKYHGPLLTMIRHWFVSNRSDDARTSFLLWRTSLYPRDTADGVWRSCFKNLHALSNRGKLPPDYLWKKKSV